MYGLWVIVLLSTGFAALALSFWLAAFDWTKTGPYILLGLINMIGVWFIAGAAIDAVLWHISSKRFRDYVRLQQTKAHSPYEIKGQIHALAAIGLIYYLVALSVIIFLA